MDILSVNYLSKPRTTNTPQDYHADRIDMFETNIKPLLESFANITFLKRFDNSNLQTVYRFKIRGFDNILLSFWFNSSNSTSSVLSYDTGLSKVENVDTWDFNQGLRSWSYPINESHKSRDATNSDGTSIRYYWSEISFYQRYIKDLNNVLQVFYCGQRTDNYPTNAYVFDKDNNNQSVAVAIFRVNEFDAYYDESYKTCTCPEFVSISFASDTLCLMDDIILVLNDTFKGILSNLVKIYNDKWNAQNSDKSTGTLIEIDGARYRQINNRLFVRDYE